MESYHCSSQCVIRLAIRSIRMCVCMRVCVCVCVCVRALRLSDMLTLTWLRLFWFAVLRYSVQFVWALFDALHVWIDGRQTGHLLYSQWLGRWHNHVLCVCVCVCGPSVILGQPGLTDDGWLAVVFRSVRSVSPLLFWLYMAHGGDDQSEGWPSDKLASRRSAGILHFWMCKRISRLLVFWFRGESVVKYGWTTRTDRIPWFVVWEECALLLASTHSTVPAWVAPCLSRPLDAVVSLLEICLISGSVTTMCICRCLWISLPVCLRACMLEHIDVCVRVCPFQWLFDQGMVDYQHKER